MSTVVYDCTVASQRAEGLAHAKKAIAQKQTIVMPTDTVYGIAADAFSPVAVATLLAAKGRGRSMPPPVLIQRVQTMDGLAVDITEDARKLAEAFWPGGLTIIFHAQPSLDWDLGDAYGTVALRMPDDKLALDLLTLTGPLAVSSANRTGKATGRTVAEAREQLGDVVEVYLGEGERADGATEGLPSTIVDATGDRITVVRPGAIGIEALRAVVPSVLDQGEEPAVVAAAEPAELADSVGSAEPNESVEPTELAEPTVTTETVPEPELPGSEPSGSEPSGSELSGAEPSDVESPGAEPSDAETVSTPKSDA